jgi:lipoprotein-releasing system ATP-binding protein
MVAIVGQSGAGKSTLLHILGALDAPTAGTVPAPQPMWHGSPSARRRPFATGRSATSGSFITCCRSLRRWKTWPCRCWRAACARRRRWRWRQTGSAKWVWRIAATIGPATLGGEQQRVALARALVNNPRLLLADEPTGDLDETTAGRVFDLIERLHASHGLTSILVTHNLDLAARCTRVLRLERCSNAIRRRRGA